MHDQPPAQGECQEHDPSPCRAFLCRHSLPGLRPLSLLCLLISSVNSADDGTHHGAFCHIQERYKERREKRGAASNTCLNGCILMLGTAMRRRQNAGSRHKPDHSGGSHSVPGVVLGPPVQVGCFFGRYLHLCHGTLHRYFGISGLLLKEYPLVFGVILPCLLSHGRQRCARRRRVAGAGVRHSVVPSAGVTCAA